MRNIDVIQENRYREGRYSRPGDPDFSVAASRVLSEIPLERKSTLPKVPRVLIGIPIDSPAYTICIHLLKGKGLSTAELMYRTGHDQPDVTSAIRSLMISGRIENLGTTRYQLTARYRNWELDDD